MTDAPSPEAAGPQPPVHREIVVAADPATAFQVWTEEIGQWWPLAEHSVFGAGGTVGFAGGRLVERGPAGDESVWGEVLAWDPPHRLRLTWHPGHDASRSTEVEITFAAEAEASHGEPATRVTLTHSGWERLSAPAAARAEYDTGWPRVLQAYARTVGATEHAPVWLALLHSAGPNAPAGPEGSIFDHPDFPEHVAFLERLQAAGVLVAAGPLGAPGNDGPRASGASGMTVIRVADDRQAADVARRAAEEDRSVARGLFTVDVRRWHVIFTG
jgi:uncharacterized protein YndB with AHSA1/START domain/uncharacterized protein YciI